jgi:hypothetical protein
MVDSVPPVKAPVPPPAPPVTPHAPVIAPAVPPSSHPSIVPGATGPAKPKNTTHPEISAMVAALKKRDLATDEAAAVQFAAMYDALMNARRGF